MPELRIYIGGQKDFARFDVEKFKAVINATDWPSSGDECINALIEHAISQATGNVTILGDSYTYAKLELAARDENGMAGGLNG